jgi:hypothetical protein
VSEASDDGGEADAHTQPGRGAARHGNALIPVDGLPRRPYSWKGSGNRGRGPARAVGANDYVVLFVAVVYFLGGYVLGRFHGRDPRPTHVVDPDPLRIDRGEGFADVIPFPQDQRTPSPGAGRARPDRRTDQELDWTRRPPQS